MTLDPAGDPTLEDVARAAGVSRATAARALGGYGSVSDAARERVLAAATALRYRPNALARSMKSGSSATIGVVVSDIQLAFFGQAVRGMTDAAHAQGFEVILANTDEDVDKERMAVGVLLDKRVDGLIVVPADARVSDHLREAQERTPVVLLDRGCAGFDCDVVIVDNENAAANAVGHLVRLGHRRIALLVEGKTALPADRVLGAGIPEVGAMTSAIRELGWARALDRAGIAPTEDLLLRATYDRTDARRAVLEGFAGPDRPTALIATDETMALGALDAIGELGLAIPTDLSFIAFDDSPWTTLVRPQVAVVAQPVHSLGVAAVERLLARIEGDAAPYETNVLRTWFEPRGSTGPVPDAAPRRPARRPAGAIRAGAAGERGS